jgi:hypothetical protein
MPTCATRAKKKLKLKLSSKNRVGRRLFWGVVESYGNIDILEVGL